MTSGRIVVGVDGSDGADAALQWAVEEARLRDATVVAVHVWHLPYVGEAAGMAALSVSGDEFETGARAVLDGAVARFGGEAGIETRLGKGDAAGTLLRVAEDVDADLLVVGSRGRGGFAGLLLGSVSQQVSHHAPCPVVIVR